MRHTDTAVLYLFGGGRMAGSSLAKRLQGKATWIRPRGAGVAQWLRNHWAELETLRAGQVVPTWDAIAELMVEDGVEGATGTAARQTYSRIKRDREEAADRRTAPVTSSKGPPAKARTAAKVGPAKAVPAAKPPSKRLRRVGQ